jgi:membrane protein implicated in regulation of membrane protease activity
MIVFMTIGGIGFVLLLVALLLGEVFEAFGGDADADGDGGDIDHGDGGPSVLSFRFIACFITGFGGGGSIGYYYGLGYVLSSGIGLGSAVVLAGILYLIVKVLYKQQASSNVNMADLVGQIGTLSVAIPSGGVGQILLTFKGSSVSQMARSEDGTAIASGQTVIVKQVVGDNVIVGLQQQEKKGDA